MPSRPAVSTIDDVVVLGLGVGSMPRRGDRDRVAGRPLARRAGCGANTCTPARSPTICSWLTASGPLQVARHQQRRVALVLKPFRELAGQRGLTGALQAGQHDHRRRRLGEPPAAGSRRRGCRSSSSLTILTTCCAGLSAPETSAPLARSLMRATNAAHHGQRNVGFQQRQPDLAGGRVDVGVGQPALAAQLPAGRRSTGRTAIQTRRSA